MQIAQQLPPGVKTVDFLPVRNPNTRVSNNHFKNNYAVLRMWELVQYKRIVAIDADMLVTRSLDHLCEIDLPANAVAASNNWWTSKKTWDDNVFNGGLMVLTPSDDLFAQMMSSAPSSAKFASLNSSVIIILRLEN